MFTIKNGEFLDRFFNHLYDYAFISYDNICKLILDDYGNYFSHFFTEKEIMTIIVLNKSYFQNQIAFFELIKMEMAIPAFNSLRSAIEALRLFRVYFTDNDFRNKYTENSNFDFTNNSDYYSFKQSKVNNVIKQQYEQIKSMNEVPLSSICFNDEYIQLSDIHSELSKWAHLLNVNMLLSININDNKIYMGIENQLNLALQYHIKKYLEASYIILFLHETSFLPLISGFSKEHYEKGIELNKLYDQFIKLFYNSK